MTVIINLALLPLRITSMKSALKTQLQPVMKAIRKGTRNIDARSHAPT